MATIKIDKKQQVHFKVTDYTIFHEQLLKILEPILVYQNKDSPTKLDAFEYNNISK